MEYVFSVKAKRFLGDKRGVGLKCLNLCDLMVYSFWIVRFGFVAKVDLIVKLIAIFWYVLLTLTGQLFFYQFSSKII